MNCKQIAILIIGLLVMLFGTFATAQVRELDGAGATFPQPLYAKMFDVYYTQTGIKVNYQGIGSGGGIQQITQKTVDFGGTDAFLTDAQMDKVAGNPILHIPICLGAVVITYNLPIPDLKLTPDVVADIFLGKIKKWDDNRITSLNAGVKLPADDIFVVHRSDGSGTSFVFTDYLNKVSPDWKQKVGAGTAVNWPAGLGGKGNPGVAGLVKQTKGAVGYVELAYAEKNKMPYATLKNKSGMFIKPNLKSTSLAGNVPLPDDTRMSITDTEAKEGYPIASFTWVIVYKDQNYDNHSLERSQVIVRLLSWMTGEGQHYCRDLLYAPLPKEAATKADKIIRSITYNGKPVKK